MSLEIPNLDKVSYDALVKFMIESIPKHTRLWTDFNSSDPGITILELLSWIAETLLYRANYTPIETYVNFLQLWAGAAGDEIDSLLSELEQNNLDKAYTDLLLFLKNIDCKTVTAEEIQLAILSFFQAPYLAVTASDYEILSLEANRLLEQVNASNRISRAIVLNDMESVTVLCVANQLPYISKPYYPNNRYVTNLAKSQTTLINCLLAIDYEADIIPAVNQYLNPRLLLGSVTTVQKPVFTPVNIEVQLICDALADAQTISDIAAERITNFLSPLLGGGYDQHGWPYNQEPNYYDISQLVITIPGVSYVDTIIINYYPTIKLNTMATLDVDAVLGDAPLGMTEPSFVGLAQAQVINVIVQNA